MSDQVGGQTNNFGRSGHERSQMSMDYSAERGRAEESVQSGSYGGYDSYQSGHSGYSGDEGNNRGGGGHEASYYSNNASYYSNNRNDYPNKSNNFGQSFQGIEETPRISNANRNIVHTGGMNRGNGDESFGNFGRIEYFSRKDSNEHSVANSTLTGFSALTGYSAGYMSVQTNITRKGKGWECKDCAFVNGTEDDGCVVCGAARDDGAGKVSKRGALETQLSMGSKDSRESKSSGGKSEKSGKSDLNSDVDKSSRSGRSGISSRKSEWTDRTEKAKSSRLPDPPSEKVAKESTHKKKVSVDAPEENLTMPSSPSSGRKRSSNFVSKGKDPKGDGGSAKAEKEPVYHAIVHKGGKRQSVKESHGKKSESKERSKNAEKKAEARKNSDGGGRGREKVNVSAAPSALKKRSSMETNDSPSKSPGALGIVGGQGLPGEGATAAIAQLLGLNLEDNAGTLTSSKGNVSHKEGKSYANSDGKKTSFATDVEEFPIHQEKQHSQQQKQDGKNRKKSKSSKGTKHGNDSENDNSSDQLKQSNITHNSTSDIPLDGFNNIPPNTTTSELCATAQPWQPGGTGAGTALHAVTSNNAVPATLLEGGQPDNSSELDHSNKSNSTSSKPKKNEKQKGSKKEKQKEKNKSEKGGGDKEKDKAQDASKSSPAAEAPVETQSPQQSQSSSVKPSLANTFTNKFKSLRDLQLPTTQLRNLQLTKSLTSQNTANSAAAATEDGAATTATTDTADAGGTNCGESSNENPDSNSGNKKSNNKKKNPKQKKGKNEKDDSQAPSNNPPQSSQPTNLTLQAIQQSKANSKKSKANDKTDNKANEKSSKNNNQSNNSENEEKKGGKSLKKEKSQKLKDGTSKDNDNAVTDGVEGKLESKGGKKESSKEDTKPEKKGKKDKREDFKGEKQKKGETSSKNKMDKKSPTNSVPPNQPQTTNNLNYGSGRPITVVHIAEKPSIAQAIAQGLSSAGGGSSSKSSRGSLPTHEFNDPPFPKAPHASKVTHRVTSVAGHVFNVDFPSEFQSWDSVDPAELFHAPVVKKPCKGSVVRHLQDVAKGVDFIVLWMDCDREGENINFEVLECCMHLMQGSGNFDRVYRAHFSAINPSDIKKAYNSLGKPDKGQSLSVDARQELDLKVGVAFSRFQTRFFQGRYGDLDSAVLSYGPCQTPTLGFCVQRHVEMETFKPEPYWLLDLGVMNSGTMCRAVWDSGRSFNRNKVDGLISKCKDAVPASSAKVVSVLTKDKKQGRPVPLNTVALLKACSKALGIGPHQALSIAERLYLSGYLSYPRTESTSYPKSYDIIGTLQDQTNDNRWGQYVQDLLKTGVNNAKGGVDMGDHPPITPCRHARAGELSGDMARVYDLVARHFIASVSHDAVWRSTTIRLSVDELGEKGKFTIRGKQLVTPGFLAIVMYKQYGDENEGGNDEEEEEEKDLPEFSEGDLYPFFFPASKKSDKVSVMPSGGKWSTLDVKEKMTTPPTYLTESELISKMEQNGIGTDASISTHIENILKRNYVELIPGRKLKPSRLGLVLAQGYHLIDNSLVLPKIRSDIEDQCNKIAKGLADKDDVVKKAIELFSGKFNYFVENINKMDVLFGSSFAQLQDVGKPFTRCGLTRRYLQYITGPPPRLYNKTTESVYPLPIGGVIKQWTGRNCPVEGCNFELCLYSVGAPERTFPLCPYCYNNPRPEWGDIPGEDTSTNQGDEDDEAKERQIRRIAGKSMIRECPHPDGHPLIREMTVSPDPESDGVLILDPHLGPKWRLVSTRDPTIVHLPKSVEKVTILDKTDEVLGCHLMSIEFKEGESPVDGKKKYTSCFANDELLQGLVRVHHGDERLKSSAGGRGRGRGGRGGRKGRGGGRGGRGGRGRSR